MANFFSLNAALPHTSSSTRRDHNSLSETQQPPFEFEPEVRHHSRTSQGRSRNSETGASIPQAMPTPYGNGSHRESNAGGGRPPFDLGRSPPNASNKSTYRFGSSWRSSTEKFLQTRNMCPASSFARVLVKQEMPVLSRIQWILLPRHSLASIFRRCGVWYQA